MFPNRDGVVVLLWLVFVFCDSPKIPPVFGVALEEFAGGLAKNELNAMIRLRAESGRGKKRRIRHSTFEPRLLVGLG